MEIIKLPMAELEMNVGQIKDLPMNPRTWTRSDIDRLSRSIKDTPELFEARPLLVVKHGDKYVILGGNLRYEASRALELKQVPVIVFPASTPVSKLKEIVIKDNGSFGDWDYDALANEWDDLDLSSCGAKVPDDWGKVQEPVAPAPAGQAGSAPGGEGINIDGLFDPNAQAPTKEHPIVLSVCIPEALADKQEDIKAALVVTLEEFPGVIIK